MPWTETCPMDQRVAFIAEWLRDEWTMTVVCEAVRGELVGLAETERGDWLVRFMQVELGRIDRQTRRFTPAWHGRRIGSDPAA